MMAKVGEEELLNVDGAGTRTSLATILNKYGQAADAYAHDLRQSLSDYESMKINQRYLLEVAYVLESTYEIFDDKDFHQAASYFEAAAWSYLDKSDQLAYHQGHDGRFTLSDKNSSFFRSRLMNIAERAKRMNEVCGKELQYTTNPEISTLRFLLDLVLELPIGAWECASCLAMVGNCKDCGYGRDHSICSKPGSNYDMLRSSRDAMLKSIRSNLSEMRSRSRLMSLRQDHEMQFYSHDTPPLDQMEIDICGQYDIVEVCD
jgi:hypothetical protein